jgi:microcystin-dependent protein
MAGSISLSLSQQFDELGVPLSGGLLYFYAAGTTTPQSAYQDVDLTIPWPNPIVLDSAGRVPPFYVEDGQIKIILRNSAGVTQVSADNLLVVGASTGTGTAPSVDATTVFSTGDLKAKYSTSAITGWVRANGRTIGSASSGGSERANADCEALFLELWTVDSNLSVSTGRGASAAADWAANKNIALPDWRGRALAGLDDMGNSAAGRLTSTYFGTSAIVLGAAGGSESHTLTTAQLATHSHGVTDPGHTHTTQMIGNAGSQPFPAAGQSTASAITTTDSAVTGISINNAGSGNAHNNASPMKLTNIYIKL